MNLEGINLGEARWITFSSLPRQGSISSLNQNCDDQKLHGSSSPVRSQQMCRWPSTPQLRWGFISPLRQSTPVALDASVAVIFVNFRVVRTVVCQKHCVISLYR